MHRSRSPRAQTVRLILVYTAMTLVVLVTLTILLLFVQGYRFNAADRSLEQGGLVQFESKPSGATVKFDNQTLSRKTSTRHATDSGSHHVVVSRDGYRPWQKTITVDPGAVHWLNYIMLIPINLEPETMYEYEGIAESLAANDNKIAILPDSSKPQIDLIDTSSAQPKRQSIEIPNRLIAKEDTDDKASMDMISWDETDNRILAKVKFGRETNWLIIDTRDPAQSINVSSLFDDDQPIDEILFDARSSKHVYALSSNSLYRVAYEDGTVPQPITTNVASISQSDRGVISFVTTFDKSTNTRSTGYYSPGADKSKIIKTFRDNGKPALKIATGEYFGDQYIATQYDREVDVVRLSLHPSDSDQELNPVSVANVSVEDGVDHLSFSPSERFVVAQHRASYMTYDLELLSVNTTTVRGDSPVSTQLSWLDDYHVWSDRDQELRLYEFDGANSSTIGTTATNQVPLLTTSGKYLYYVSPVSDNQQALVRIQLIP